MDNFKIGNRVRIKTIQYGNGIGTLIGFRKVKNFVIIELDQSIPYLHLDDIAAPLEGSSIMYCHPQSDILQKL